MNHFIGGSSIGFIVLFFYGLERGRKSPGDAALFGLLFCWPFGAAAWGLL